MNYSEQLRMSFHATGCNCGQNADLEGKRKKSQLKKPLDLAICDCLWSKRQPLWKISKIREIQQFQFNFTG